MHAKKFLSGTILVPSCLLGALVATSLGVPQNNTPPSPRLALRELKSSFHQAVTCADYDLMLSLWSDDAVWTSPGGTFYGPTAIADFFASGPGWGQVASLASSYKSTYDIHGTSADFSFECIIVDTFGADPLTTPLSTLPFGNQNPRVEIVQHSNATCTAVRSGSRWVFQAFAGAAGPIMP
jgi:hypothetical protein